MQNKVFENHYVMLFFHLMNRVERVEHARERDNVKMGRKSLAETSPRASEAKALVPHGITCLEIATKNPQNEKIITLS